MKDTTLNEIEQTIRDSAKRYGAELQTNSIELRKYIADRIAYLATVAGQPGYGEAAEAEARNVAMFGIMVGITSADQLDSKLVGVITGVLLLGLRIA